MTLVKAAHEILSYLNATRFEAPVHPALSALADHLEDAGLNEIYRVGLTGSSQLMSPLLAELTRRDDEDDRMFVFEALARIRSEEAVTLLGQGYDDEGADARWATIKAMGYIGGESALGVVRDKGTEDEYLGAQTLARRILERNAAGES